MKADKLRYASDKTLKEKLEIWFIKDHRKGMPAPTHTHIHPYFLIYAGLFLKKQQSHNKQSNLDYSICY